MKPLLLTIALLFAMPAWGGAKAGRDAARDWDHVTVNCRTNPTYIYERTYPLSKGVFAGKYNCDRLRHGAGVFTWKDGTKREGTWENGKLHGTALVIYKSGKIKEEQWDKGELISSRTWSKLEIRKREKEKEKIKLAAQQRERIYDNCIIDKLPADANRTLHDAVKRSCKAISEEPSFWDKIKYD